MWICSCVWYDKDRNIIVIIAVENVHSVNIITNLLSLVCVLSCSLGQMELCRTLSHSFSLSRSIFGKSSHTISFLSLVESIKLPTTRIAAPFLCAVDKLKLSSFVVNIDKEYKQTKNRAQQN